MIWVICQQCTLLVTIGFDLRRRCCVMAMTINNHNLIFLLKIFNATHCHAASRRAHFAKNIMPAPWQNQG
jgi:hypothetical protein